MDRGRARRGWLPTFVGLEWRADERALVALLDALTRDRLEVEAVERERSATARRSLAEVQADHERIARDELAEARRELDEFRAALEDVRRRGGTRGQAEVPYDSAKAPHDQYADVLIQYLVRPGYAEVRTEEPTPGRYVYHVRVDWPRLRKLAESSGHSIPF